MDVPRTSAELARASIAANIAQNYPPTEPVEPDNPAAHALATHIADHPISTIQAAFRYLGWNITISAVPTEGAR
ncbi:hypothetical protein ACIQ1S_09635 [Streptomyces griseus]|uniref:hypothetical protein n=1 Tax=Streptomyces griseus TaxID=1911 RepID=UPI003815166C